MDVPSFRNAKLNSCAAKKTRENIAVNCLLRTMTPSQRFLTLFSDTLVGYHELSGTFSCLSWHERLSTVDNVKATVP